MRWKRERRREKKEVKGGGGDKEKKEKRKAVHVPLGTTPALNCTHPEIQTEDLFPNHAIH